jgi:hypothetical protein
MEAHKELILELLVHDMQYHQLLHGLARMGFDSYGHGTNLLITVARLMNVAEADISQPWIDAYMSFLHLAQWHPPAPDTQGLQPLARACYTALSSLP